MISFIAAAFYWDIISINDNNAICFVIFLRRSQRSDDHLGVMFTVHTSRARTGDYSNHHND
jgi:hypothetical protein